MSKRKKTGERELHLELWNQNKHHTCQNCRKELGSYPNPAFFSHILPKGKFPEHRLNPNNFKIICFDCHQLWEFGTLDKLKDFNLTGQQWRLIKEYNFLRYCKLKGI